MDDRKKKQPEDNGRPVILVREGRVAATIIVPDDDPGEAGAAHSAAPDGPGYDAGDPGAAQSPAAAAREAAEILRRYIARASGAELPVRPAAEAPAEGTLVLVGRSALSERYGLEAPTGSEAARVATFSRGLAIIGEVAPPGTNNQPLARDRGTRHGVYLFLEKQLGFRFYFAHGPDADLGIVVPDSPTITVAPLDETSAPAFPYRLVHGQEQEIFLAGSGTAFLCNHTHYNWDRYYRDEHPEYFSLQEDGRRDFRYLCYGNPEVLERELEHIEIYLRGGEWRGIRPPTEKYILVEPADNWRECRCRECRALVDPGRGGHSRHTRLWWDWYIRRLALAAARRWPEKRVSALAYQDRMWPGEEDLPDNVDVMACIHNAPVSFHKEPVAREEVSSLIEAWSRKVGGDRERLYVWEYFCYPRSWTCAPIICPNLMQRFLRENRPRVGGMFIDGASRVEPALHFMVALTMRLLWDPDLDVNAWIEDYCRMFFGPAADAMERAYRLLIDRSEQVRWPGYVPFGYAPPEMFYGRTYPPEVIERFEQLLCEAQAAAGGPPGGRPAGFGEGEGWFVRRNPCDEAKAFEVVFEAGSRPVHCPVLRWDDGELAWRGTLPPGYALAVTPGPRAELRPSGKPSSAVTPGAGNVTAEITGDVPAVPGRTTRLFHVFSRNSAAGVSRLEALDRHLGGDGAEVKGPPSGRGPAGEAGAALGVTVRPAGEATGDGAPTIYQRRVAWMRDAWENFPPQASMSAPHYGFLPAARTAHRWIGHAPEYRVARAARPPRPDPADPAWREASVAQLVRGRSRAQVPADNLGFPAGNAPTLVRFLRDERNLYAYFQCFQPEPPGGHDLVTLALYRPGIGERGETIPGVSYPGDNPVFSVSARPGEPEASGPGGTVLAAAAIPGGWAAFMTVPAAAVPGGLEGEYRADLLRARGGGLQYLWSPPLDAPWVQMPMARRGRLAFEAR